MNEPKSNHQPNLLQVMASVLASMFGVQSNKRREQDFTHGKPIHYISIGLLFTVLFVLFISALVKLVLHLAGV